MSEVAFPTNPDEFTTTWLERALKAPRGALRGFASTAIGTGQMCQSYRIALDWFAHPGPATIVAKCPTSDPGTRAIAAALGNYTLEINWYRELASEIPVSCPKCLHLESAENGLDFVLLLSDCAPARQGDQLAGATVAQIEAAIGEAANLHAPLWNSPRLATISWLQERTFTRDIVRTQMQPLYAQFRERYAQRLSPEILEMGAEFVSRIDRYQDRAPHAVTIQHRDFRIDNLLFAPDGRVFVVDWQTVGIGPGAHDVAYLIGTSIADPDVRAREERRLVALYCSRLRELGVAADESEIWEEYRLNAFSGFLMAVFASMNVQRTERGDEMFAVMAERPALQALHLDSLSLL